MFPSDEELAERYKNVSNNIAVNQVAGWKEPNFDEPTSEVELLDRATGFIEPLSKKLQSLNYPPVND